MIRSLGLVLLCSVRLRDGHVGGLIELSLIHHLDEFAQLGPELVGDLAPLPARGLGGVLGEGAGYEGRDHAPTLATGMSQHVAQALWAGEQGQYWSRLPSP